MGFGRRKSRPSRQVIYAPSGRLGLSAMSAKPIQTAPVAAPAAPGSVVVTAPSSNQVQLSWVDLSSTETRFAIQRALNSGFTSALQTFYTAATTYTDLTVAAETSYYYRVRAEDQTSGQQSVWVNANTFPVTTPPFVPAPNTTVPEIRATHPRLGFTDAAALRARLVNPAYPERAMFETWLQQARWTSYGVTTAPGASSIHNQQQNAAMSWAFLAALDPAAIRAVIGSVGILANPLAASAATAATKAYDILVQGAILTNIALGNTPCDDTRHVDVCGHETAGVVYDWAYAGLTPTQRADIRNALIAAYQTSLGLWRPWDGTAGPAGRLWLNSITLYWLRSVQGYLAILNEAEWTATQQQDCWARMWSFVFETQRPSSRFRTFTDGTPAYQSATPNTVRLDARFGGEVVSFNKVGAGAPEAGIANYAHDDWVTSNMVSLLSRTAFVGTAPTDSWLCASGVPEMAFSHLLPHFRSPGSAISGLSVSDGLTADGIKRGGIAYKEMGTATSIAAAQGDTNATALGHWYYTTANTLPTDIDQISHAYLWSNFIVPHRHVSPSIGTVRAKHAEHRYAWLTNPTSSGGSQVRVFGTGISGGSHTESTCIYDISCQGRLVIGRPLNNKAGWMDVSVGGDPPGRIGWAQDAEKVCRSHLYPTAIVSTVPDLNGGSVLYGNPLSGFSGSNTFETKNEQLGYLTTANVGYIALNCRPTWQATRVQALQVEFVQLRGLTPELLIRYDRATLNDTTTHFRLNIHVAAAPTWYAPVTPPTDPRGIGYWLQSTDPAAAIQILNVRPARAPGGTYPGEPATNGRLWVTPLLPSGRIVNTRGGWSAAAEAGDSTGLWMWQGGTRPADDPTGSVRKIVAPAALQNQLLGAPLEDYARLMGWGRIEIWHPTNPINTPMQWLTAHEFGDATAFTSRTPVVALTDTTAAWDGAQYQHATNGALVWFVKDPAQVHAKTSLIYEWTPSSTTTRHLVADVVKSTPFYVQHLAGSGGTRRVELNTVNTGGTQITSNAAGILTFTTTGTAAPVAWS